MYYIERKLLFNVGVISKTKRFHRVSYIAVDYINRKITLSISSWEDKKSFLESMNDSAIDGVFNDVAIQFDSIDFNIDPVLFALTLLIKKEDSLFYRANIKRVYNFEEWKNEHSSD